MAEAKGALYWGPWSIMISMYGNVNRDKKKHPRLYRPKDFNPYYKKTKKKPVDMTVPMKDLKQIFMGMKYK